MVESSRLFAWQEEEFQLNTLHNNAQNHRTILIKIAHRVMLERDLLQVQAKQSPHPASLRGGCSPRRPVPAIWAGKQSPDGEEIATLAKCARSQCHNSP
jgi:hypothetical protein